MPIQLPDDAVSVGYKETKPFHQEQVFQSKSANFTGTEKEFVAAGHGYEYVQTTPHTRSVSGVSLPQAAKEALPELCFIFMEDAEPGKYVKAVKRGESGCFETTYDEIDAGKARALVAHLNRKLGVSALQAECMQVGSMFGWDAPGADPDRLAQVKLKSAKEMLERVAKEFNGDVSAWNRAPDIAGLWEFAELTIHGTVIAVGASGGGVVQVDRQPFDPNGVANDNADSIGKSISAALAKHGHRNAATSSLEAVSTMSEQRERVYDFPNGYRESAENMYRWLRHEGFTPEWDFGVREGEHRSGITIPANEVPQLRIFQKTNPARWGNHPDVAAELKAAEEQGKQDAAVNRQRLDRLNPEQRDWIEKIHYETGAHLGQALDLNDKLHDLAAKHLKLCLLDVEEGLSSSQEAARDAIEGQIREACNGIKGIKDAKFLYDPRGTTVAVVFESGAYNSFSGGWKVPIDPKYLKSLDVDNLTSEYSPPRP